MGCNGSGCPKTSRYALNLAKIVLICLIFGDNWAILPVFGLYFGNSSIVLGNSFLGNRNLIWAGEILFGGENI